MEGDDETSFDVPARKSPLYYMRCALHTGAGMAHKFCTWGAFMKVMFGKEEN